jgi:quinol monooxygenase YgiN
MLRYKILFFILFVFMITQNIKAQNKDLVVRIARLVIDSTQLDAYKTALKLHAETALKEEPGVLNLYAVYEKNNPTHITVFEIYANEAAYKSHLLTPHFLKYKTGTKDMVKSLELVETVPIALQTKFKSTD